MHDLTFSHINRGRADRGLLLRRVCWQVVIGMDVASSEFRTKDDKYDLDFKVGERHQLGTEWVGHSA